MEQTIEIAVSEKFTGAYALSTWWILMHCGDTEEMWKAMVEKLKNLTVNLGVLLQKLQEDDLSDPYRRSWK